MWDVTDRNKIAVFFRKAKWPLELSKIIIENSLGLLEYELLHFHPYSEDHVPVLRKTVG